MEKNIHDANKYLFKQEACAEDAWLESKLENMKERIKDLGLYMGLKTQKEDCLFKSKMVTDLYEGYSLEVCKIEGEINGVPLEMIREETYNRYHILEKTSIFLINPNCPEEKGIDEKLIGATKEHYSNEENIHSKYDNLRNENKWTETTYKERKYSELKELFDRMDFAAAEFED